MVALQKAVCSFQLTRSWRVGIVAESPPMKQLLNLVERLAASSVPVLLLGETGTGKEVLARALHEASGRPGSFIPLNCAAIPATLAESELLGHVRGAFTGAERARVGLIEQAHQGTLFLDEVSELEPIIQAKLLRVVEDGLVRKLGGRQDIRVHVRLVCATNKNPTTLVAEGKFRQDLFYRLAGVTLEVPPLREHQADIRPLVEKFVQEFAGSTVPEVSEETIRFLDGQAWPGNVRELRQAVQRAVLLGGSMLQPEDFGLGSQFPLRPTASPASTPLSWRQAGRASLLVAIEKHGSVLTAARDLGIPRSTAYDWLRS